MKCKCCKRIGTKAFIAVLLFFVFSGFKVLAQEEHGHATHNKSEHELNRHVLALSFNTTYIHEAVEHHAAEENGVFVPGIGVAYSYKFLPKFSAGVMFDGEFGSYRITTEEDLKRESAAIAALILSYHITHHFHVFGGGGMEYEKSKSFGIFRLGLEYGIPLNNDWALPLSFIYDGKRNYYSLTFAVGIVKEF